MTRRRPKLTRPYVTRYLRLGLSASQIAARSGYSLRAVELCMSRHDLTPEAYGLTRLARLAAELGVSRQALAAHAAAGRLTVTYWGHVRCLDAANTATARELLSLPHRNEYPGWLDTQTVADACGTTQATLHRLITTNDERLRGIRIVRCLGAGGRAHLICPSDVPLLSSRLRRRGLPRRYAGRLSAAQLADALGVPGSRVRQWTGAGLPCERDWYRRCWYAPGEVRGWLAGGTIRPRDLALLLERLDGMLTQGQAA